MHLAVVPELLFSTASAVGFMLLGACVGIVGTRVFRRRDPDHPRNSLLWLWVVVVPALFLVAPGVLNATGTLEKMPAAWFIRPNTGVLLSAMTQNGQWRHIVDASPGQTVRLRLLVTNNGTILARNVMARIILPAGVTGSRTDAVLVDKTWPDGWPLHTVDENGMFNTMSPATVFTDATPLGDCSRGNPFEVYVAVRVAAKPPPGSAWGEWMEYKVTAEVWSDAENRRTVIAFLQVHYRR